MQLKAGGKALVVAVVAIAAYFGYNYADQRGYFNTKPTVASSVPTRVDLPSGNLGAPAPSAGAQVTQVALAPAGNSDIRVKFLTIPWNGTLGLMYANGGPSTAPNSLMAKAGVKLDVQREDDYGKITAELVAFAEDVSKGVAVPNRGAAFAVIMGDALPGFAYGAQQVLNKLGQEIQVVGAIGFSRGEDKCMLPAAVKADPQKARGSLIGGVLRDGDVHICMKWAGDNGIPVNPDEKTYDPNAMNFVSVSAFTEADEKLINGYCENRPEVNNGKKTGKTVKACQNGTATWTPGDVNVVTKCNEKRLACAGIASVASTREYAMMMPSIVIGNKQWMAQNSRFVEGMLSAAWEGGELVRSNDVALTQAAETAAKVFKEEDGAYWKTYFKGKEMYGVQLGGSTTIGLADNVHLFGVGGKDDIYKRVYTVFGEMDNRFYPSELPRLVPYNQVVTSKYIESVASKVTRMAKADLPVYRDAARGDVVAKRAWTIEFDSGKATFNERAATVLDELLNQVAVSGMSVQINGHTDSTGDPTRNQSLSKERADAVKNFLMTNSREAFPESRIATRGYGQDMPVESNASAAGRSRNRRVEVILRAN